ncbi:unnamed protein product [Miscanthus lutarioriparius]|uniref:Uncharacterized protein n=1 Tax=Miscanthus lutarioriparius TaxID=422564 RepID=A0A811R8X1_9POAL|nr:unnamed protein product [Miscanthus lutarioriparius]
MAARRRAAGGAGRAGPALAARAARGERQRLRVGEEGRDGGQAAPDRAVPGRENPAAAPDLQELVDQLKRGLMLNWISEDHVGQQVKD